MDTLKLLSSSILLFTWDSPEWHALLSYRNYESNNADSELESAHRHTLPYILKDTKFLADRFIVSALIFIILG